MSTPANELPLPGATSSGVVDLEAQFLGSFGMPQSGTSEPPLRTDDLAGDKDAGAKKSDAGKETDELNQKASAPDKGDKPAGAAKAGEAAEEGEGDKDLEAIDDDDDGDRAIKAAAPEHKTALERIRRAAKFEDHVRDATKPPKDIVDYLKGISAARYSDISAEVVKDRLGNIKQFIDKDLDDATYAKLANEMIERDPHWLARLVTGRKDATITEVVEALDAKANGKKDAIVPLPDLDAKDPEFPQETLMESLEQDWPEAAEFLKSVKQAREGTLPKAFTSKLSEVEARAQRAEEELAALKAGKGKAGDRATKTPGADDDTDTEDKSTATVHPDTPKIRLAVEADLGEYVEQQARHKDGLGLDVSDEERETAPDVADLKETMLDEWVFGSTSKKVPSFLNGLMLHFKGNAKFMSAAKQVAFYSDRGEETNALAESKNLRKFIDAYRKVRVELPQFKRLNGLIASAAKNAGRPAPHLEKVIPGGGSQTASPTSAKGDTDDDIVNGFGLG